MKKLLTSLLSLFMVLTVAVTVNADDGDKVTIGFKANIPNEESVSYGEYDAGLNVTFSPKSYSGYRFESWSYVVYSNNVSSLETTTTDDNYINFVIPSECEDGSTIVLVANYVVDAKVENGENTTVSDYGSYEKIVDAVKKEGIDVDLGTTITLNTAIIPDAALTEGEAEKIINAANDLNNTGYYNIKVSDEYDVVVGYDFQQIVTKADGTETTLEINDYGTYVTVKVETPVSAAYLEKPEGYTRIYWFVVTHEDGLTDVYYAHDVNENGFQFDGDKNSIGRLLVEDLKIETEDTSTKYAGPLDTNHDGIVDCVEENGKGWVWSQSKNACVYSVTNTSAR